MSEFFTGVWAVLSTPMHSSWFDFGIWAGGLLFQFAILGLTLWRGWRTLKRQKAEWDKIIAAYKDLEGHGLKLSEEWAKVIAWRALMESRGIHIEGPEVDLSSVTKH